VSVTPANGALNVPRSTTVVVTFSEPAKASTVTTGSFRLLRGGVQQPATVSLSPDGLITTLTPAQPLADEGVFTVSVGTQVTDRVGHPLASEFRSTFSTPDDTPPVVTSVNPPDGATNVPLNAALEITFNEPLDPSQSLVAGVIRLYPYDQPQALVPLDTTLEPGETKVVARPSSPLEDSTQYVLSVSGQRDRSGNVQAAVFSSSFQTVDLTPPVVEPIAIDGQEVFTRTPQIWIRFHDISIDRSSVVFKIDGQDARANATVWTDALLYQAPATNPMPAGPHSIEFQIKDTAGNTSELRTASFKIHDTLPDVTFTIGGFPAVDGMNLTSARPWFLATYSDPAGIDFQTIKLLLGQAGGLLAEVPANKTGTTLIYQPPSDLAEGSYIVQFEVADVAGNLRIIGPLVLSISFSAPEIISAAPNFGNQHGGTTLVMTGNRLLSSSGDNPVVEIGGNRAWVVGSLAGSPDQLTVVTPPGVPGPASIEVITDRGVSVLPSAFVFEPESKTPFAVEPDTVLLWHMDEPSPGSWGGDVMPDSGPFDLWGEYTSTSQAVEGRFGYARSGLVWNEDDNGVTDFGKSSFTVDCWFRSSPVPKAYMLAGKQVWISGYGLSLLPSGAVQAWIRNESLADWSVQTPGELLVADDRWHSVSMVVDRENQTLSVYVDGLVRAATPEPANFGDIGVESDGCVSVGEGDYRDSTVGPQAFPGAIDEVRLSSRAHGPEEILQVFQGTEGPLPFSVFSAQPALFIRGTEAEIALKGYNLYQPRVAIVDGSGAAYPAEIVGGSATESRVRIPIPPSATPGSATLEVRSPSGALTTFSVRLLDREHSLLRREADTLLLWHLDEPGEGRIQGTDSGPLAIHPKADWLSSISAPALFGNARQASNGPSGKLIDFSNSSFTLEGWVKEGRTTQSWDEKFYSCLEQPGLYLGTEDGYLDASIRNASTWISARMPAHQYDEAAGQWIRTVVTDGEFHYIAVVVDRDANEMRLYMDGTQRAARSLPAEFGPLYRSTSDTARFQASGLWDEVRISSTAHTAEKIWEDFAGEHSYDVTSVAPRIIHGASPPSAQNLSVEGFDIEQVHSAVLQNNQPAGVSLTTTETSYGRVTLLAEPGSDVLPGPAELVISNSGSPDLVADLLIVKQAPFPVDVNTLLLWRLDESDGGAVTIADSGAFNLQGTSSVQSKVAAGRFGGGRQLASIESLPDAGRLQFGSSSFSVDFWLKTGPVPDPYVLVARSSAELPTEFDISILKSGALSVRVFDTAKVLWNAETKLASYDPQAGWSLCVIDDGAWHSVSVVVDRDVRLLSIYVDGSLRVAVAAPAVYGAVGYPIGKLKAGYRSSGNSGPLQFPGVLDEIRISSGAHLPERIWSAFSGMP